MEKLPLIELAELNKSIIFLDSFQDIFSIADLDGGMDIRDPDSPERFAPMRLNALLMVLTFEGTLEIHLDFVSYIVKPNSFITIMPTHALHIVRYSLSPVTSTRITIVQKLLRRNQQATFKIFTFASTRLVNM